MITDLDAHLIYKRARQIFQCLKLFGPVLSQTLTKQHDGVSLLTNFLELKLDHRFGCQLDRQACTQPFTTLRTILTPFKPNPIETAQQSFTFEQVF